MRFRSSIPDFQLANPLYRGAVVSFFEADENGIITDRLAELFAAPLVGTRIANPVTLDGDGKFFRPVYIDRAVIGVVSSSNVPSHPTGVISPRATYRGEYAPGLTFSTGDWVTVTGSETRLLVASDDFTSGPTLAADIAAGRLRDLLGSAVLVGIQLQTEALRNDARAAAAAAEDDREQTGQDVITTANNRDQLAAAVSSAAGSASAAAGSAGAAAGQADRAKTEADRAAAAAATVDTQTIAARFTAVEMRATNLETRATSLENGKLDKAGGTVTGALRLEPLTLAANNGAADFAVRSIFDMSMSAAMTMAVSNLVDGQSGQVFLTYTGGALSFSGVDRWAVSDAEVATAFTATAVGAAGLVANATYEFIFTRSGGITQGRVGRRS